MFLGSLLGGLGAGLLGGVSAYASQKSANEANRNLAERQMQFQHEMSGTAYQRAVADMRQAGLNPMLAYSQGPASAPPGAMAQMQPNLSHSSAGDVAQTGTSIGSAISDYMAKSSQIDVNSAIKSNYEANVQKTNAETSKTLLEADKLIAEMPGYKKFNNTIDAQLKLLAQQANTSLSQERLNSANTKNALDLKAPTADPAMYRDLKELISRGGVDPMLASVLLLVPGIAATRYARVLANIAKKNPSTYSAHAKRLSREFYKKYFSNHYNKYKKFYKDK